MLFATHCNGLVLGIGKTVERAERDAARHGADPDLEGVETCRITLEASVYVLAGGDCRGLLHHITDDPAEDYFSLAGEEL